MYFVYLFGKNFGYVMFCPKMEPKSWGEMNEACAFGCLRRQLVAAMIKKNCSCAQAGSKHEESDSWEEEWFGRRCVPVEFQCGKAYLGDCAYAEYTVDVYPPALYCLVLMFPPVLVVPSPIH